MKIVLDTNVIVSGLLSPFGAPAEIIRLVAAGYLKLCYDSRVLAEYRTVLLRPKFGFDRIHVNSFIDQIKTCGYLIIAKPLSKSLPDPDDESFLEITIAGKAQHLVTGNKKHYPTKTQSCKLIVSPSEFLEIYRKYVK